MRTIPVLFLAMLTLIACGERTKKQDSSVKEQSQEVVQQYRPIDPDRSNIHFANTIKETQDFNYLLYPFIYFGGGVSTGDINNDGLPDIYFTSNMGHNALYLNQGDFKFKNITKSAGVEGTYNHWTTGTAMADINNDGYLDIYVSVAGPGTMRKNLLYINQKNETFKEQAEKYGLADYGHTIQSTFFDYDNDGDLDLYVGNYPTSGFNQKNEFFSQKQVEPLLTESDRLYRNDGETFVDVTRESGILNYGLTLGISNADFNADGYMDLYVSNDFNSPDYLYINNGDGTFSDQLGQFMKHTSNFGMGTDVGDINNDGHIDLLQLDMMGSSNEEQKKNMSAMNTELFYDAIKKGLHHQYMKNTLQLNTGANRFLEISELAGISYTDWSWGTLLLDMDNDSFKDIFITNGMRRNVNDNDFNAFFRIQKAYDKVNPNDYLNWLKRMPVNPTENFVFHNQGDLTFKKSDTVSGLAYKGFSNGAAYADFDGDGDLDMAVNNLDAKAQVFENHIQANGDANYLRIRLKGETDNAFGIGSRVCLYAQEQQCDELVVARGYESSVEPVLHFGLGTVDQIDSLKIHWPKGGVQLVRNVSANQLLEIQQDQNTTTNLHENEHDVWFATSALELQPTFKHVENPYNDFEREVLLPHKMSEEGPALAVGDINGDGLDDFYIGGSMGFGGAMYVQQINGSFQRIAENMFEKDKGFEDVSATFFDANNDGFVDLYVVSGGNERPENDSAYQDRLYINDTKGGFIKANKSLPTNFTSGSCVKAIDYDKDGDLDLFVGGRQVPGKYPTPASSSLLRNDSRSGTIVFKDVTERSAPSLLQIGMITDALWADMDNDGFEDLLIVGEWMSPKILKNKNGTFLDVSEKYGLEEHSGWWNTIVANDLDNDGDLDLVIGNLGLNYKYKASEKEPFGIFANDFDENNTLDIVLGFHENGEVYPLRGRQCSSQQIPSLKKKFPNYTTFANANLTEVYSKEKLKNGIQYQATVFENSVFLNESGKFKRVGLPNYAQTSSVNAIVAQDFNLDGNTDLLIGGNRYGSEVETPRNDASIGTLLLGDGSGNFEETHPKENGIVVDGEIKNMRALKNRANQHSILIARNNESLLLLRPTGNL